jgi:hypothetical protein
MKWINSRRREPKDTFEKRDHADSVAPSNGGAAKSERMGELALI